MRMRRVTASWHVLVLVLLGGLPTAMRGEEAGKAVTFESLLNEMVDRARHARLPDPPYTLHQASSYERLSRDPADGGGWFANRDWSQFLRSEEIDGRTEWVMMDAEGAGAVVRFWVGGPVPKGLLRFYLDNAKGPALVGKVSELFTGKGVVRPPLSAERARGWNLYLPVPYAKHCKITYDGPNVWQTRNYADRIWYNIKDVNCSVVVFHGFGNIIRYISRGCHLVSVRNRKADLALYLKGLARGKRRHGIRGRESFATGFKLQARSSG